REYQQANNLKTGYDGKGRDANDIPQQGESYVVRFQNPQDGVVSWDDAVQGRISISNHELDARLIQRAEGSPPDNFCVG
ncbi:glutamate--tRNA ligase, partial [Francisella tularensis subsp. holarctica]|uniref:glutamate--tRNA ligase family protein n=1 Tax=Francisella tularensis TaxID=263 RepID=UPI0023819509